MYQLKPLVENVEISKISTPFYQIRSELEDEQLVKSIRENGLLQAIIVRVALDKFQLVAGQRRLEACKKLGLRSIPCQIIEADDKEAFEISLIENIERKTMNPLDEARAFKRYVDDFGFGGMTELAKKIGKSVTYVSRRIALLQLPPSVQENILRRRKSLSAAVELLSVEDPDASIKMAEQVESLNLSIRETRRLIKRRKNDDPTKVAFYQERNSQFQVTIRAVDRCITSLKLGLVRIDDAIESIKEDWVMREVLFQYRVSLHDQIDSLIRLKNRIRLNSDAE